MFYTTVDEKDHGYAIMPLHEANRTVVEKYAGDDRPLYTLLITGITLLDDGTIKVEFEDKDYNITSSDDVTYRLVPEFTHAETIRVNQTFVAMCLNLPPELADGRAGTGLKIFQYRGVDMHMLTQVKHLVPLMDGTIHNTTGWSWHGDVVYGIHNELVSPPREIPVHKFLSISAYTENTLRCDYPEVIKYTVDAKKVRPTDIKAAHDVLYDMYK